MEYIVAKDGRISIKSGGRMLLEDLYPGMDGSEVHPIRVTATKQRILWELSEGSICLEIEQREENRISFRYCLDGWKELPHTFYYFYRARTNAEGFYQAAEGMGGDTGFWTKDKLQSVGTMISYGLGGLQFQNEENKATMQLSLPLKTAMRQGHNSSRYPPI